MVTTSCGLMPPSPTLSWEFEYFRRETYRYLFQNLLRENGIMFEDDKSREQVRKLSDMLKEVEEHAVLDNSFLNLLRAEEHTALALDLGLLHFVDSKWWNMSFFELGDTFNRPDFPCNYGVYSAVYYQSIADARRNGMETAKDAYNLFVNRLQDYQRVTKKILNNAPLGLMKEQVKNFWSFICGLCQPPPAEYDYDDDE